jgi:predicted esterase
MAMNRRTAILNSPLAPSVLAVATATTSTGITSLLWPPSSSSAFTATTTTTTTAPNDSQPNILKIVTDPKTYSALVYSPPGDPTAATPSNLSPSSLLAPPPPLILVLHGAGRNDLSIYEDLGNPFGEHAGLVPALIESKKYDVIPKTLLENFCVLAPYSYGKSSFYNDSRGKLLEFCTWAVQNQNTDALPIRFDPDRIILFGFSDGATVAVELLTTRRFAAGIICSYGYTGESLPPEALDRLKGIPTWVFHSQDDVIFDVRNSDRLVAQLRSANQGEGGDVVGTTTVNDKNNQLIRYSRYTKDPENLPPRVRGHSMGITASKSSDLYDWLLKVTAKS